MSDRPVIVLYEPDSSVHHLRPIVTLSSEYDSQVNYLQYHHRQTRQGLGTWAPWRNSLQTAGKTPPLPWHFSWLFRRAVLCLIRLSFHPDLVFPRWEVVLVRCSPPPLQDGHIVTAPPPLMRRSRLYYKPGRPWSEPYEALVAFRAPCTTIGTISVSSRPFSSLLARHAVTGDVT